MTTLAIHRDVQSNAIAAPLPAPRSGPINVRHATMSDIKFIDALQKKYAKNVGFMWMSALEKRIEKRHVVIAEESNEPRPSGSGDGRDDSGAQPLPYGRGSSTPIGYCIFDDTYLKRQELGIVYQLVVVPGKQRGLVGAALIKAVFEQCPYGVKLFCCWCAQDLEANHFWESIGFVPIAFRAGSRPRLRKNGTVSKPGRTHIFWQRRIREGDTGAGATPYWFPSETRGGALKEARIVLPIPPGTHWSDAKPAVFPGLPANGAESGALLLENEAIRAERKAKRTAKKEVEVTKKPPSRGLWFAAPAPLPAPPLSPEEKKAAKAAERAAAREKRPKLKNDPKYVAAARELRDRYMEEFNSETGFLLMPAQGKYDVSRQLEAGGGSGGGGGLNDAMKLEPVKLLNAA